MAKSPIKIIDSGNVPTTKNLGEGQIAFGTIDGETKLYGSDGVTISELGGGGGSEVNSIAPLKVNTAPTTDADTVANVAVGELAKATIGDLSGLSENNRAGMEALVAEMGGAGNTSIGLAATTTGFSCMAIGYGATAGGDLYDSSAGDGAICGGYASVALGPAAIASEAVSIAIGSASESKSPTAVAIGHIAKAQAADATTNGPVAVGERASATGASSVAIGARSKATEANEFSIGDTNLTRRITHVTDPTGNQDAATKNYVDTQVTPIQEIFDAIYPIGIIVSGAKPSLGTWEKVEGRFLFGSDPTHDVGGEGGEEMHTLTINEIPLHNHTTQLGVGYYVTIDDTSPNKYGIADGSYVNMSWGAASGKFTGNTGGSRAHNNMPPYLVVDMWRRTA